MAKQSARLYGSPPLRLVVVAVLLPEGHLICDGPECRPADERVLAKPLPGCREVHVPHRLEAPERWRVGHNHEQGRVPETDQLVGLAVWDLNLNVGDSILPNSDNRRGVWLRVASIVCTPSSSSPVLRPPRLLRILEAQIQHRSRPKACMAVLLGAEVPQHRLHNRPADAVGESACGQNRVAVGSQQGHQKRERNPLDGLVPRAPVVSVLVRCP
mmetsp:Transcript_1653/g.3648  ORF Transcript_1653/g.3648 Transcript_1653/m.3648 type:complete len:214 (+) Transcript_1653:2080-2721(+)